MVAHMGGSVREHFQFGSSTRDTILPRSMDEHSDIDYMIVFEQDGKTPQAYLDRLKKFVGDWYARSEVYQSSPTIVLELNHIKFELVPAQKGWFAGYNIPKGTGNWQSTDPNDFNQSLEHANKNNAFLIKPTIRLAKMWNAANGYPFESFEFEKWISERSFFFCRNQKDYLFDVFDGLSSLFIREQWKREKIERAKRIVNLVREHERSERSSAAEKEIARLIP